MKIIKEELDNMRNSLSNMLGSKEFELADATDRNLMQALLTIADSLDVISEHAEG